LSLGKILNPHTQTNKTEKEHLNLLPKIFQPLIAIPRMLQLIGQRIGETKLEKYFICF
jgi:K+/H+ antiporter YhaU regulatory subunit KhtT